MKKDILETEVLQMSVYIEIITELLYKHKELSPIKVVVFAFLNKKTSLHDSIYATTNKTDVFLKYISQLSGLQDELFDSMKYVFSTINLMMSCNLLKLTDNLLSLNTHKIINEGFEQDFSYNAIEISKRYSDKQFLKEVLNNV